MLYPFLLSQAIGAPELVGIQAAKEQVEAFLKEAGDPTDPWRRSC